MTVSIEEGRYYKKLNPAYKFKEYLYKVFYEQENTIFRNSHRGHVSLFCLS